MKTAAGPVRVSYHCDDLSHAIPPHVLDATPQMVKFPALKNKSMGTAYWRQKGRLNESDLLILRGFAQGVPTAQLARELECDRLELLKFRYKLQDLAYRFRDPDPETD